MAQAKFDERDGAMNASELAKARSLALGGADHVKVMAPHCTVDDLRAGLEYARSHKGSKTLITAFEREIRKKKKEA